MNGTARSLLLGSILVSAIGFTACSDEVTTDGGAGGATTTGGKASTGGTSPKGGGTSTKGGAAGSSTGGTAGSSAGGTAGSSAGGTAPTTGGAANNAGSAGNATGGAATAGNAGTTTGTGGASTAGTAGTPAATGGAATAGAAGTPAATGGAAAAGAAGAQTTGGTTNTAGAAGSNNGTAGAAGSACVTPYTLYDFSANTTGWVSQIQKAGYAGTATGATATITLSATEGKAAAGALQAALSFGTDGVISTTYSTPTYPADISCYTKFHAWLKISVAAGDVDKITEVHLYTNTADYAHYAVGPTQTLASINDGNWHEFTINLPALTPKFLGVEFKPSTPPAASITLLVDDVWLE